LHPNQHDETIVYPTCISSSSYGITLFWAEEYWAWLKVQELRLLYPQIDLTGLINQLFENQLPNLTKISPHMNVVGTKNYNEIPIDSWDIDYRKLNIATSHAPSRFKAQNYLKKYTNDFRIITFDAHLDIGRSNLIHAAWLTEDLAKRSAIIGGWSEASDDMSHARSLIPFISTCTNDLIEKKGFKSWITGKKVYLTIDLDFFPSQDNYMGLSSFWHRNLFLGHAMNIKQRIEIEKDIKIGSNSGLVGVKLQIFDDIVSFMKQKKKSIRSQIDQLNHLIEEIAGFFQENSAYLLGLDLVEYSPICDWQNLTINSFKENFQYLSTLISTINE